jgi:hypothetical protein
MKKCPSPEREAVSAWFIAIPIMHVGFRARSASSMGSELALEVATSDF